MASLLDLPTSLPPDSVSGDGSGLHHGGQEGAGRAAPGTSFSPRPGRWQPGEDWAQEVPDEIVLEVLREARGVDLTRPYPLKSLSRMGLLGYRHGFDGSARGILACMVLSETSNGGAMALFERVEGMSIAASLANRATRDPERTFLLHQNQTHHLWPGGEPVRCHWRPPSAPSGSRPETGSP